jgi:hypothetical protein
LNKTSAHVKWQPLLLGGVLAVFISLGVHSVMLDQMHIPYPTRYIKSTWLRLPDLVLMTFGVFYLRDWLPEAFRSTRGRIALLLCVLLPAYKELFLRQPLMQMAVTNTWNAYPFLDQLPKVLPLVLLLASVAGIADRVRTVPLRLVCSVILAAVFYIGLQPVLVHAYAPIKAWTNTREGELVFAPDSVYIDSWAYLTFVEPVIAAFVIAWLTWERFPGHLRVFSQIV